MQFKTYNSYSIVHTDGVMENVNAENMLQALSYMEVPEEVSPVSRALMVQSSMRTLVEDLPPEIVFTAVVSPESVGGGNIATPAQGQVHAGDEIQLKAIPERNWEFVEWKRNGLPISKEAVINYIMEDLAQGEDTAIFEASFALSPVAWTTAVADSQALEAGCIAFPTSGVTPAETKQEFLAVPAEGYAFTSWTRDGEEVGTEALLTVDAITGATVREDAVVYTANFAKTEATPPVTEGESEESPETGA